MVRAWELAERLQNVDWRVKTEKGQWRMTRRRPKEEKRKLWIQRLVRVVVSVNYFKFSNYKFLLCFSQRNFKFPMLQIPIKILNILLISTFFWGGEVSRILERDLQTGCGNRKLQIRCTIRNRLLDGISKFSEQSGTLYSFALYQVTTCINANRMKLDANTIFYIWSIIWKKKKNHFRS